MIYLIDTCVFSEMLKPRPAEAVRAFMDRFLINCRLCAPMWLEVEQGLALSSDRGARSRPKVDLLLERFGDDQWLVFDRDAAAETAMLVADAQRSGRPISIVDAQILGIAAAMHAAVATRDTGFLDRGVKIVNPWTE